MGETGGLGSVINISKTLKKGKLNPNKIVLKIQSFSDFEKMISEIDKHRIVFASSDKYWTEGLENHLVNSTRIFFDRSDEENEFSVYDELKTLERKISTLDVLKTNQVKKLLESEENFKLLTFKPKKVYGKIAEKLGGKYLLSQNLEIADFLENKIKVRGFFEELGIKYPRSAEIQLSGDSFEELKSNFGLPFVLQLQFSAAGEGTFLINSREDFDKVMGKNEGRKVKIMEFINGQNLTINACTSPSGTVLSQGIGQITGIPELVEHSLASCGTDFSFEIDKTAEEKIWEITKKIGDEMRKMGFRGIFGVDFIWNGSEIYTIEINPRMVASIPIFTKLEIVAKRIPLLVFHYLELLGVDFEVGDEVFEKSKEKISGAHIFLKNFGDMMERVFKIRRLSKKGLSDLKSSTPRTPLEGGQILPLRGARGVFDLRAGVHTSTNFQIYLRNIDKFQKGENFGRVYFEKSVLESDSTTKLK